MSFFRPKQVISVTGVFVGTVIADGKSCVDATGKVIGSVDVAGVVSDATGNVVGFVQGSAAAIAVAIKPAPGAQPLPPAVLAPIVSKLPKYPTAWQCMPGFEAPIRRENNDNHDISCMALDGKNCVYQGGCSAQIANNANNANNVHPLVCGSMHQSIYGISGYNDSKHWCTQGSNMIPNV